ncbi:MAG: cold shock and DUF1294 domain-containing protein [Thiobacillaceae bacterium]|jgi:uncharacterized membrane protein YsdA (DUF1294 family)/cold shock CspA family protein|nr:cold shock and DUF1294 domain-containing protein [Thiobacillaceae bacterium]
MRHQGRITHWKNDKGFGFITPKGGGEPVFAHLRSFSNRKKRPAGNELVTYELKTDAEGRAQAHSVAFVGERTTVSSPPRRSNILLLFALLFIVFVATMVFSGRLPYAMLWLYLGASMLAFIAYAFDKSAAIKARRRTGESSLHLLGLIGGWPGALAAQQLLRHKSSKASFQGMFLVTVAVNCCGLGWLLTTAGRDALRAFIGSA